MQTTYYDLFGVPADAPIEVIRRAYRSRAKRLHPDRASGDTAAMAMLNQAYETLRDPGRRRAYDASLMASPAHAAIPDQHPPDERKPQIDPHAFLINVVRPANASLRQATGRLQAALAELAYDIYDETYLARFMDELTTAEHDLEQAHRMLRTQRWPEATGQVLQLYVQGLRLIDDAMEEFKTFNRDFDVDVLAYGGDLLERGLYCLGEARSIWA
jgi:hypothetical protein